MSEPLIKLSIHGPVATVILNQPARRNALSRAMLAELDQSLSDLHLERRVRAVVITGSGAAFCAGLDLQEMAASQQSPAALGQWQQDAMQLQGLYERLLRFPKPVIAAVNGAAMGGGLGLALACDLAIAARSATFAVPEPRRGIVAGLVAPLLSFRAGAGRAAYLLMSSRTIGADEAERAGLVQHVVEDEHIWVHGTKLAEECAAGAPTALLMTKRLINETIGENLFTQLSAGAATSAASRTTEAATEGIQAFLAKRAPHWG